MPKSSQIIFKGQLESVDPVHKVAYGWSYITKKGDKVVTDHSGDTWDIAEVEKTAHQFVCDCRVGGESHVTKGGAELVESIVFSRALQDALGIDIQKDGESVEGWFVGFRITDADLLDKVEKGVLCMFSIGGSGIREGC
jgi:Putative phage serine protease XkdF